MTNKASSSDPWLGKGARKYFPNHGWSEGTVGVVRGQEGSRVFHITYKDGDEVRRPVVLAAAG
jgi:predicted oxidoreductase